MKLDALDHPKTMDFAARLSVELPTAIGYLELLWAFTGKKSPQGNIGKWPDGAIARACYWNKEPEIFVRALVDAGFLDEHPAYRYMIHDWLEHAPRWVKSKLKSLGLDLISSTAKDVPDSSNMDTSDDTPVDTSGDTSRDTSSDTKGSEVKGSEVKGSEGKGRAADDLPDWLDRVAWSEWEQHRRELRKSLTPSARKSQIKFLNEHRQDHASIIRQSIRCSWTGLFPLKNGNNGQQHKPGKMGRAAEALRRSHGTADSATANDRGTGAISHAGPPARLRTDRR